MILNFIFLNLNIIVLSVWVLVLFFVGVKTFYPNFISKISYKKILLIVFSLHIFYGLFTTLSQYYVWSKTDLTGTYTKLSYFIGYAFMHYWLNIILLFSTSLLLYLFFRFWKFYKGGFSKDGPILLFILMLISGWPGILISIPLGFIVSILFFVFFYFKKIYTINVEKIFIFSTFIVLLFPTFIFSLF